MACIAEWKFYCTNCILKTDCRVSLFLNVSQKSTKCCILDQGPGHKHKHTHTSICHVWSSHGEAGGTGTSCLKQSISLKLERVIGLAPKSHWGLAWHLPPNHEPKAGGREGGTDSLVAQIKTTSPGHGSRRLVDRPWGSAEDWGLLILIHMGVHVCMLVVYTLRSKWTSNNLLGLKRLPNGVTFPRSKTFLEEPVWHDTHDISFHKSFRDWPLYSTLLLGCLCKG